MLNTSSRRSLADVVNRTAHDMGPEGRFGAKVFVSAIYDALLASEGPVGFYEDFQAWLVAANRDGLVVLARADLVAAMDRDLVERSEFTDRGATFHFVVDQAFDHGY